MNQEIIDLLMSIYKLSVVKELYDQRIIDQDNYKEYLMMIANGTIELQAVNDNNKED